MALSKVMNDRSSEAKKNDAASIKNYLALLGLFIVYLLCALRYYPGRPWETFWATAEHLLASVPFAIGFTLFFVSLFSKTAGQRPSMNFIVRLFLTIGICIEFFFGLYHYLATG